MPRTSGTCRGLKTNLHKLRIWWSSHQSELVSYHFRRAASMYLRLRRPVSLTRVWCIRSTAFSEWSHPNIMHEKHIFNTRMAGSVVFSGKQLVASTRLSQPYLGYSSYHACTTVRQVLTLNGFVLIEPCSILHP